MLKILVILIIFVNFNEGNRFGEIKHRVARHIWNGDRFCDESSICPQGQECKFDLGTAGRCVIAIASNIIDSGRKKRAMVGGLRVCDEMSGCPDGQICKVNPVTGGFCVDGL